ncbi:hypothetical protein Tco_1326629 [Tanacetum coccineum]
MIVDIENVIMDPVMQCTTLPSHAGGTLLQPPITKTKNIRVILFSIHSDDENPSSVNIKQYCVMRTCKHGESNTSILEGPTLQAGNSVKEEESKFNGNKREVERVKALFVFLLYSYCSAVLVVVILCRGGNIKKSSYQMDEVREKGIIQLGGGHYEKNKDFVFESRGVSIHSREDYRAWVEFKNHSKLRFDDDDVLGVLSLDMRFTCFVLFYLKISYEIENEKNIKVILFSIHSDDGNPSSANIKQALRHSGNENMQVTVILMLYVLEDLILQAGNPVKEVLPN